MTKRITDENGIIYEEVSYQKYLESRNRHRILKSLESQYFVEIESQYFVDSVNDEE